jgi:hypothetical protein
LLLRLPLDASELGAESIAHELTVGDQLRMASWVLLDPRKRTLDCIKS